MSRNLALCPPFQKKVSEQQATVVVEIPGTFPGIHSVKTGTSITAANAICDTHILPVSHTLQLALHQGPCQIAELFQGLAAEWEAQVTTQAKWCVTPAWKRGKAQMNPGLLHFGMGERQGDRKGERDLETW